MDQGAQIKILTHRITSPTLLNEISIFQKLYPKSKCYSYQPIHNDQTREATKLLFGKALRPIFNLKIPKVIVSFDYDFLGPHPAREKYSNDFMSQRMLGRGATPPSFNRLYVIEPSLSITGANADHRWGVKPTDIQTYIAQLATLLGLPEAQPVSQSSTPAPQWLHEIANELRANPSRSLVIAGEQQSAEIQALIFSMNHHLNNIGTSINFIPFDDSSSFSPPGSLEELVEEMNGKRVDTLFILGANPVYDTPATLDFRKKISSIPCVIKMGTYDDETSYYSHWNLPESHFLESWGDLRAFDGTVSIQQPLISPLYNSRSLIELFSILTAEAGKTAFQSVKNYWKLQKHHKNLEFDQKFEVWLKNGFIEETEYRTIPVKPLENRITTPQLNIQKNIIPSATAETNFLEAVFKPDFTIWDGRYSNNGWLQELPKPLLQVSWDNIVALSADTARQMKLSDEDQVELRVDDRTEKGIILRVPGHPEGTITLYFGYGRVRAGFIGNHYGYNAYSLQDHRSPYFTNRLQIKKLGIKKNLARVHTAPHMEGRDIIVHSQLKDFETNPSKIVKEELKSKQPSLLSDNTSNPQIEAWGMVIDLTTCIGCKSCTIACQAENNIPIVGKENVRKSRQMHWIRVDRYFHGHPSNPKIFFQPVPCMHCEKAPCEEVCPTVATNHSKDGLNQMVYNRCVGTRYCSNNCPYKVRRFNFFQYSDTKTPTIRLMQNPNVTVRSRGVMEKCTYCVQRIQSIRIEAEKENRPMRDLEVLTACQQSCPTDAIIFGNLNDSKSRVSELKKLSHHYSLLNELGTQPRTTYLSCIRNSNLNLTQENSS